MFYHDDLNPAQNLEHVQKDRQNQFNLAQNTRFSCSKSSEDVLDNHGCQVVVMQMFVYFLSDGQSVTTIFFIIRSISIL